MRILLGDLDLSDYIEEFEPSHSQDARRIGARIYTSGAVTERWSLRGMVFKNTYRELNAFISRIKELSEFKKVCIEDEVSAGIIFGKVTGFTYSFVQGIPAISFTLDIEVGGMVVTPPQRLSIGNNAVTWQANYPYYRHQRVIPTTPNGLVYRCIQSGTSGSTEPSWSTTLGGITNDGTVVWETYEWDSFHKIKFFYDTYFPQLKIRRDDPSVATDLTIKVSPIIPADDSMFSDYATGSGWTLSGGASKQLVPYMPPWGNSTLYLYRLATAGDTARWVFNHPNVHPANYEILLKAVIYRVHPNDVPHILFGNGTNTMELTSGTPIIGNWQLYQGKVLGSQSGFSTLYISVVNTIGGLINEDLAVGLGGVYLGCVPPDLSNPYDYAEPFDEESVEFECPANIRRLIYRADLGLVFDADNPSNHWCVKKGGIRFHRGTNLISLITDPTVRLDVVE